MVIKSYGVQSVSSDFQYMLTFLYNTVVGVEV